MWFYRYRLSCSGCWSLPRHNVLDSAADSGRCECTSPLYSIHSDLHTLKHIYAQTPFTCLKFLHNPFERKLGDHLDRVTFTIPAGIISKDFPQNLFFHRWSAHKTFKLMQRVVNCWSRMHILFYCSKLFIPVMRAHPAKSRSCPRQHGKQIWVGDGKPVERKKK